MIWKPVEGYEGLYEVSDSGQVRSLPGGRRLGKILCAIPRHKSGHLGVNLHKEGKRVTKHVHKLVAAAFIGPCPDGLVVCHGPNGVKDNSVSNLSYGTTRKNAGEDYNRDHGHKLSSKHPGVCWHKRIQKWQVNIHISGKKRHIGYFIDEEEAAEAYRKAFDIVESQGRI